MEYNSESFEEYRLTWTYPYLEREGKFETATGRIREETKANAMKNEGYYWAGKELKWEKRKVRVVTGEWVDISPIDPVI